MSATPDSQRPTFRAPGGWILGAGICYAVITALLFRNVLPVIGTHLFGDLGDPLLNASILMWNTKHVPLTAGWWNYPAFAPLQGVTAFTEHMLGAYPLTTPLIWISGNPILAYNVLELGSITLNGVATYALVRELTGSRVGGFVGGLAFAFAPFVGEQASHIQMLMAFGMPVALLGLHRFLKTGSTRDLALFAAGWLDVLLSNAYMLVFFPILVALWALWFFRRADMRRWIAIAIAAIVATLPLAPLLFGYQLRLSAYGFVRGLDEIKAMSATFASIAGISHRSVLWVGWLPDKFYEASLFPGFAIATLACIGVVTAPRRRVAVFYLAGAIAMWLLALGPERGPYWLLLRFPGAQSIRVPARAWLPATLCLAVCAGFGAAWLASGTRTRWLLIPFCVLLLGEGWFAGPAVVAPAPIRLGVPAEATVLDLPIGPGYGNTDAEYRAVLGNYRVVNGYSGYAPSHFGQLRNALADHRPEAFAPFRQRADLYVVVRPDVEMPFVRWLESQDAIERLPDAETWKVYRLPRQGAGPASPPLLGLPGKRQPPFAIP